MYTVPEVVGPGLPPHPAKAEQKAASAAVLMRVGFTILRAVEMELIQQRGT
jgi:hypothetical protein